MENLATLAWAVYANEAHVYTISRRFTGGNRFHRCFGINPKPPIHFVGAWDTVSSFGWFWNFQTLPYTAGNPSIVHIRHALAFDKRRACFPANLFFPQEEQSANCKQVWFAGVHGDVGGGYPEQEATLAKVPLAWMIREAEALGLLVDAAQRQYLMDSENKPPPDPYGPIHESVAGFWKAMEYFPRRSWDETEKRMRWHGPHCGRRRPIEPASDQAVELFADESAQRLPRGGVTGVGSGRCPDHSPAVSVSDGKSLHSCGFRQHVKI